MDNVSCHWLQKCILWCISLFSLMVVQHCETMMSTKLNGLLSFIKISVTERQFKSGWGVTVPSKDKNVTFEGKTEILPFYKYIFHYFFFKKTMG